jgi:2'-5' RNA ligase
MNWYKKAKKECEGWIAVRFSKDKANKVKQWGRDNITNDMLYTAEGYGRESDTHITVMYGVCSNDVEEFKEIIKEQKPIKAKLGKIGFFCKSDDFDVVIIKIESKDLKELHRKIKIGLEVEETFPIYKPHCCIAYVKKGEAAQFAGETIFEGDEITFNEILFKDNNKKETIVKL